jgi:hypothetical protein
MQRRHQVTHTGQHQPNPAAQDSGNHNSFAMLGADLVYNHVRFSPVWLHVETAPGEIPRSGGARDEVFSWSE